MTAFFIAMKRCKWVGLPWTRRWACFEIHSGFALRLGGLIHESQLFEPFWGVIFFGLIFLVVEGQICGRVVVVCDLDDGSGFGEVEAFGCGLGGADDLAGKGLDVEVGGVAGGQLQTVEQGRGTAGLHLSARQRVDDDGEGDLNGFAIFERYEFDVLHAEIEVANGLGGAKAVVTLVKARVEVAPMGSFE
jgi:hypothetical protein